MITCSTSRNFYYISHLHNSASTFLISNFSLLFSIVFTFKLFTFPYYSLFYICKHFSQLNNLLFTFLHLQILFTSPYSPIHFFTSPSSFHISIFSCSLFYISKNFSHLHNLLFTFLQLQALFTSPYHLFTFFTSPDSFHISIISYSLLTSPNSINM